MALALPLPALAQQYQSEARVLPGSEPVPEKDFDAEQALEELKDNPYGQAMTLRQLAAEAARAGNNAAAAEYLKRAIALDSLSVFATQEMQRELALLLVEQGDYAAVVENLAPIVASDRKPDPALLIALAGAHAQLGNFAAAAPLVARAMEGSRTPPHDWYALAGAVEAGLGRWKPARDYYLQAISRETGILEYWRQLSVVQLELEQPARALAAMEMAYRQGLIERSEDRLRFAQLFLASGVPFEAASLLQSWLEEGLLVAEPATQELIVGAWLQAREDGLALPVLQDVARATGKARWYLQLGQISFDRGDWDGAAQALQRALEIGAGRHAGPARVMRGVALYQLQRFGEARKAFVAASEHKASAEAASQWIEYLDSGLAREEAMRMAARGPQDEDFVRGRFSGQPRKRSDAGAGGKLPKLTPVGAERAANAEGTIPAWTGGLTPDDLPAGFVPGSRLPDPWPEDRPLFTIDASNWREHAGLLSFGHQQLFLKYDDYRMPVYPSRRSVSYPEAIYEATQANRGKAALLGSDALSGARLGFPFPVPDNGVEIMWNHRVRFRGNAVVAKTRQAVVQPDGDINNYIIQHERVYYRYAHLDDPVDISRQNILLYYITFFGENVGRPEFVALVHETANSITDPRNIWVLAGGMGKLFRLPPLGYDQSMPTSGGIAFIDMIDMYNGAFDRYDWQLQGKRELYLAYNSYRLNDGQRRNTELLSPRFLNPDLARYELHRVWVIEASERGGKRHSFGARRFYVDEDSWNVVLVENYDREGRLWRFQEGHLAMLYDWQWSNSLPVVTYDFKDGRYFVNRLTNEDARIVVNSDEVNVREFMPAVVKARYSR